jgi:hypothetical protein
MHRCLIYSAKKPLIQQKQEKKTCLASFRAWLAWKTRQKDVSCFSPRLISFKDKTQDMSWKPPKTIPGPRSKRPQKPRQRQKITMHFTLFFVFSLEKEAEQKYGVFFVFESEIEPP